MTEKEILELFKYRYINSKNNNYIFTGIKDFKVLNNIPDKCSITFPENNIDIEYAHNIKIDLNEVGVNEILSYTLNELKKLSFLDQFFEYSIDFNNKFDLLKFQGILRNYNLVIQLIFYNFDKLTIEEQMLFNEIYYFNSEFFDANSFIKENNFQSYFLNNGRVLDYRENYTKIKMIKHEELL